MGPAIRNPQYVNRVRSHWRNQFVARRMRYRSPEIVGRGAKEAMDNRINTYTRYDGLDELREAIAGKQKWFTGMDIDPGEESLSAPGQPVLCIVHALALLDPGNEVIVFEPYYGYHISTLVATHAVPVYVRMVHPDWTFTYEDLERAISSAHGRSLSTRRQIPQARSSHKLNSIPLRALQSNTIFLCSPTKFEHFVYDGRNHIPGHAPRHGRADYNVSGLSKTFSITGWRIGYCLCDARWAQTIGYFNDLVYVCAPAPLQMGVAKGLLTLGPQYYAELSREYKKKRDRICDVLAAVGLQPACPRGPITCLPTSRGFRETVARNEPCICCCRPGWRVYRVRLSIMMRQVRTLQDFVLPKKIKSWRRLASGCRLCDCFRMWFKATSSTIGPRPEVHGDST